MNRENEIKRKCMLCLLILLIGLLALIPTREASAYENVTQTAFGTTKDGLPVQLFTLTNKNGMTVRCINYGCRITSVVIPAAHGETEVVLGFETLAEYEADTASLGAVVGRFANRIKNAEFTLNGETYNLMKNDGENYLHGSFNHRVYDARATENGVIFTYTSPDGEDGFPGELFVQVTYTLDDENRLTMDYRAISNRDTVINLTNHAYFNLFGDGGDMGRHLLQLSASRMLEAGRDVCPTGKILETRGTAFDFSTPKPIGRDIEDDDPQLAIGSGYDHCFIIDRDGDDGLVYAARATNADSSISMRVYTTQPGIQLYTGNFLAGKFARRSAFCLETQHYPDSPNMPSFPSTVLRKGDTYRETTVLDFDF